MFFLRTSGEIWGKIGGEKKIENGWLRHEMHFKGYSKMGFKKWTLFKNNGKFEIGVLSSFIGQAVCHVVVWIVRAHPRNLKYRYYLRFLDDSLTRDFD